MAFGTLTSIAPLALLHSIVSCVSVICISISILALQMLSKMVQ